MPAASHFLKDLAEKNLGVSTKKIFLLYLLGLVLIVVFYVVVFMKPSVVALIDFIPKIRGLASEIKAAHQDLPFKQNLLQKQKSQRQGLAKYEKKLSKEKELPVLLENLSKMARASRVKISGITPSVIKKGKGEDAVYREVPIQVSAQSGYHELGSFINNLENDTRYMQISGLKIQANHANPKRHNIDFVIYAYTFKQSE